MKLCAVYLAAYLLSVIQENQMSSETVVIYLVVYLLSGNKHENQMRSETVCNILSCLSAER